MDAQYAAAASLQIGVAQESFGESMQRNMSLGWIRAGAADMYVTVADEVVGAGIGKFPTATKKIGPLLT